MPHQLATTSQRLAAHPHHSAWVAASAGSGKTKVLTDRVLNLLLEGCAPERILCLTFTKAAAAEMANRVRARLGEWAILEDTHLANALSVLQGVDPSPEKLNRARTLFGLILDTPGGLKIQTIHSFCQSLLKRFPLEAGLSPFFEVADTTQQKQLLQKTSHLVMEKPSLTSDLEELIRRFSESTLEELHEFVLRERTSFFAGSAAAPQGIRHCEEHSDEAICLRLPRPLRGLAMTNLLQNLPEAALREELGAFEQGSPTDQERGAALAHFLALSPEEKAQQYETYVNLFLTQQAEKRARLLTQKAALYSPRLLELLEAEAFRLEQWKEQENALTIETVSHAFFKYGKTFLEIYETLKQERSLLDYDDLILKTVALLKDPGCHWVLYKLDGGLDHILVDEAQDTNPAQWQVIRALAEEFYANAAGEVVTSTVIASPRRGRGNLGQIASSGIRPSRNDEPWPTSRGPAVGSPAENRTLFIVGDGKQSIYSFQGADPAVFSQMQQDFRRFAHASGKTWQDVDLNVSFRSAPEILATVDAVFSPLEHLSFRKESPGHVELWPLLKKEKDAALTPWQPPLQQQGSPSPQKNLADLMAKTIRGWLQGPGPLPRPVVPGDILILVRRRTSFVDTLIKALKENNVPVAGIDRLWLLEGIGVQDLLKIAEFLLLPEDDLSLATVLKGPLFGLSEGDLFNLAHERGSVSLWKRLQEEPRFQETVSLLKSLLSQVDFLAPFALFSLLLGPYGGRQKWQARLGPEVLDSLDEFLNLCLVFQDKETPSLQKFLEWISKETLELKRDLDQSNQVRIMTVHGSKGLQAPIVFLPDTTQPPQDLPPFAFFEGTLTWLPPATLDTALTKRLKQDIKAKQQEEYLRLLYVALTRAEDALFICGWEASSQQISWYDLVKAGLQTIGEEFDFKGDVGLRLSSLKAGESTVNVSSPLLSSPLPSWLKTMPARESPLKVLTPSQMGEREAEFHGSGLGDLGARKGTLIHKLLEFLPHLEPALREKTAARFLAKECLPLELAQEIANTALTVLNRFPDFYTRSSLSEVSFQGKWGDHLVSGQIDRLVMMEDHILLIDYKSNAHVPQRLDDISPSIIKQMATYRAVVAHIYPRHTLHCGILWTTLPRFDILPDTVLKKWEMPINVQWENDGTGKASASIP